MNLLEIFFIAFFAGFATVIGGFLGVFLPVEKKVCIGFVIGFGAGVMIGVSLFSLMPEGYYFSGSCFPVGIGFFIGLLFMQILSSFINKNTATQSGEVDFLKIGILMALGIAFHNFPEGLALGAGFQGSTYLGFTVAFALMLHNIPEGMCIAAPLKKSLIPWKKILIITAFAGFVTPIGAIVGWWITAKSIAALSMGMGFAAGAMIYISFVNILKFNTKFLDFGIFLGILLTFFLT